MLHYSWRTPRNAFLRASDVSRIDVTFNYNEGIKLNGFTREIVHLTGYVGQRIT